MAFNTNGDVQSHGTRKAFLIPLAVDAVLAGILCLMVFPAAGMSMEAVVLGVIFITLVIVLGISLRRKALIGPSGVTIAGLTGAKEFAWEEITNVDALIMKKKAYLLLTTTRGFHALSNNLSDFAGIVSRVFASAGDEKIEPAARTVLEDVPRRMSDLVMLWLAAVIMIGVLFFKIIQ